MNESLFHVYVAKFFPQLQRLIETINGKRNEKLTYLHKTELKSEFAPDNKWESTSVNTTYVAADIVAVDSEIPIKSRDSIASANGKLPKIAIGKTLKESDINTINIMQTQGGNAKEIAKKLANDAVACSVGLDERNEYNYLFALCHGYVGIEDADTNQMMRLNFNYLDDNQFSATVKGQIDLDDIKKVIEKADADGNTIIRIKISKTQYANLRKTTKAKELYANYAGQVYTNPDHLLTPTASKFNEAFADDNNGIQFEIVDRSIKIEKNGKRTSVKPWNNDRLVFLCSEITGTLVYGRLAEQTNPVAKVDYQTIDGYKLISKYSETNPLREFTTGQAFVAPIIEDVDQIYVLDIAEGAELDKDAEKADTTDTKVTISGDTFTKESVIKALNEAGANLPVDATDADIIAVYNTLSARIKGQVKQAATKA